MMVPMFGRGWGELAASGLVPASSVDLTGCVYTFTSAVGLSGSSGLTRSPSPPSSAVMAVTVDGRGWTRLAMLGEISASSGLLAGCLYSVLVAAELSGSAGVLASQAAALSWAGVDRYRRSG
jgi:hypothetical protein